MSAKILIVEDQFVEASTLKRTLEKAGHIVCGIAMSFDQALPYLKMERPDIVLLDIFLKGSLTGIDLASILSKENIPFIYLSANSNASTLEAAKATRPYGFLVKPFREKDVLIALDIAGYRHNYSASLLAEQERLLRELLDNVVKEKNTPEKNRILLAKALKRFVPFEYIVVDTDRESDDVDAVFCCQRIGYDDYLLSNGTQFLEQSGIKAAAYNFWRNSQAQFREPIIGNNKDLIRSCNDDAVLKSIMDTCKVRSKMGVPLLVNGTTKMYISFFSKQDQIFRPGQLEILNPLRSLLTLVIEQTRIDPERKIRDEEASMMEISQSEINPLEDIVGKSPKLLHTLDQVVQVANYDTLVLILGETGVGKEGLVKAIHKLSGRGRQPFIKINCAAIPASLIESELFGHERGAFTGATDRRIGKFEQAQEGTIFLDEIGELPLEVQSKLLRVLQEKEVERIGGRSTIKINARIVAATNRNLYQEVASGKFRMDLYYRINIFPIILPPLRERKEDIPLLVEHFLKIHGNQNQNPPKSISSSALKTLLDYSWPGNIRELEHIIERNVILNKSKLIDFIELPEDVIKFPQPPAVNDPNTDNVTLDRSEIIEALTSCNGKISGSNGTAELLGVTPSILYAKMKKLGIEWKYKY